jgi:hypothetical protein
MLLILPCFTLLCLLSVYTCCSSNLTEHTACVQYKVQTVSNLWAVTTQDVNEWQSYAGPARWHKKSVNDYCWLTITSWTPKTKSNKSTHCRILSFYWIWLTWYLTLREEHKLRVFQNRVLRRIFGPKRDEVMGAWRKLHNKELHDLYSLTPLSCFTLAATTPHTVCYSGFLSIQSNHNTKYWLIWSTGFMMLTWTRTEYKNNNTESAAGRSTYKTKQTPWPLVRKWTIPTEWPPLVDEI